ncbi:MAG: prepilin peptidase [Candidatus Saccharimonadales bacterium]
MAIIGMLVLFGLCLGSFVNALVWRLREQETEHGKKKPSKAYLRDLSISKGRSMCPDCHHELAAKDLVPVMSWARLAGRCRYCRKPISAQYPIVELVTAAAFVTSYVFWPQSLDSSTAVAVFVLWLLLVVGFMALVIYDLKWFLLPDRIVFPLMGVAAMLAALNVSQSANPATAVVNELLAVAVGGGIFYLIYQVSAGKWIGGGDVKLGWLLGLVVGTPILAMLLIFLAAVAGSLVSIPMLAMGRMRRATTIPFGPFLIVGAVVAVLFGQNVIDWYQQMFLFGA